MILFPTDEQYPARKGRGLRSLRQSSSLQDARSVVESCGLTVESNDHKLVCYRDNSPRFTIFIKKGEDVQAEAKEMGEEYANYRPRLKKCDARFEIYFDNLSEVLAEINTLIEIEICLQEATKGIVFTSWNGIIEV